MGKIVGVTRCNQLSAGSPDQTVYNNAGFTDEEDGWRYGLSGIVFFIVGRWLEGVHVRTPHKKNRII